MISRKLGTIAAFMMASAIGASTSPAMMPRPPRIQTPAYAIRTKRQTRKIEERQRRKARRRQASIALHREGEKARSRAQRRRDADQQALQAVINAMSNHERHLWSRHCGNDRNKRKDIAVARRFQAPLARLLKASGSARVDPAAIHP